MNLTPIVLPCRQTTSQFYQSWEQRDLEPAWQEVYNFDYKFCAGSRQLAQAAFVVHQTMGCDPCRLAAPPPHFAFDIFTSQPVQRNARTP